MPKKIVVYKKDNVEHNIEMRWGMLFRNFIVLVNGQEVGRFENQKELTNGKDFKLLNGETLHIKKTQKMTRVLIEVFVNGQPVAGSDSDPQTIIKEAYGVAQLN